MIRKEQSLKVLAVGIRIVEAIVGNAAVVSPSFDAAVIQPLRDSIGISLGQDIDNAGTRQLAQMIGKPREACRLIR